jgi:hypothetical protein
LERPVGALWSHGKVLGQKIFREFADDGFVEHGFVSYGNPEHYARLLILQDPLNDVGMVHLNFYGYRCDAPLDFDDL